MVTCPNCGSEKTRRGGNVVWIVSVILIAIAVPAVLLFKLNAAIIAGVIIAVVLIFRLFLGERVCLDCGHQWRGPG